MNTLEVVVSKTSLCQDSNNPSALKAVQARAVPSF